MSATARPSHFYASPNIEAQTDSIWFIFDDQQLLLINGILPTGIKPHCSISHITPLGLLENTSVFAARLANNPNMPKSIDNKWVSVRASFHQLPEELFALAGYAFQVIHFHQTHQFCGSCGRTMQARTHECSRFCLHCQHAVYPRLSPVVIILIYRDTPTGRELLLARGPHFAPGVYSCVAGFVEPSESLEDACHREIKEEVGVKVKNLRYQFSQPWPFPHSLMTAFTAEYHSGQIIPQPEEIEDAQFFKINDLPIKPTRFSTAYRLIAEALAQTVQS